jgi:enoyl-CoA hydratase/carnithine racemase
MRAEYKTVRIAVEDSVALLTIDNPPVNQMAPQLSRDLTQALTASLADPEIKALVLTGAGKNFVAGADITEIQSVKNKEEAFQLAWRPKAPIWACPRSK